MLYLGVVVPASVIIPIVMGMFRYRYFSRGMKLFFTYLVMAGIVNAAASILAAKGINNMPLLHLFTVAEFVLLATFYRSIMEGRIRKIIIWLCMLFILASICNVIFFQNIFAYNTIIRSVEALIITGLAIIFFFRQLITEHIKKNNAHLYWINAGVFLYFAADVLLFLFAKVLIETPKIYRLAWTIHASFVLLMYLLSTAGFLQVKK